MACNSSDKDVAAMLDELTIGANEESFVISSSNMAAMTSHENHVFAHAW